MRGPAQGVSTAAITAAILRHEPLPMARFARRTPPELERIVAKLLKKPPEHRYQIAKDLLNDLPPPGWRSGWDASSGKRHFRPHPLR